MLQVARLSLVTLPLTTLVGCSPDFFGNFFPRSAVAPQLLAVSADPDRFPPENHPLRDVANGTIIDDLAGLTGFWGTTETRTTEDVDSGEATTFFEIFRVLEINVNNGTIKEHLLQRCVAQGGCGIFGQDTEQIFVTEMEMQILASNRFLQNSSRGDAIASSFNSNGDVDFNLLALVGADLSTGASFETLFTVQGDFLKTLDGGIGATPEDVVADGFEEEATTLWVRITP